MRCHVSVKAGSESLFWSKLYAVTKVKMKISKLNSYTILFTKEGLSFRGLFISLDLSLNFKKWNLSKYTLFSEFGIEKGEIVYDLQKLNFFIFKRFGHKTYGAKLTSVEHDFTALLFALSIHPVLPQHSLLHYLFM